MIDATLGAVIAGAALEGLGEPAPADGFGDVLAAMLAAAAGAPAAVTQGSVEGEPMPQAGDPAPADAPPNPGAAPAAASAAALTAQAARAHGKAAHGRDALAGLPARPEGEPGDGHGPVQPLPAQAQEGKAGSSAWQASAEAAPHAPAWSAVATATQPAGSDPQAAPDARAAQADAVSQDHAQAEGQGQGQGQVQGQVQVQALGGPVNAEPSPARADLAGPPPAELASGTESLTETAAVSLAEAVETAPAARRPAEPVRGNADVARTPGIEATGAMDAPAGDVARSGGEGAPVAHVGAGVLQRVLDAVEAAAHRPPPNTMAVELAVDGAEEVVRLLVSVRGDTVQVTGGPGEQGLPPGWARPLADALAERGMALDGFAPGDSRGRRERPDRSDDSRPRATAASRAARADDGALRL